MRMKSSLRKRWNLDNLSSIKKNSKSKMQLPKDHSNSRINISIKVSGKMIKEMAEESSSGKMAPSIKATGRTILLTATEDSFTQMATSILEVGLTIEQQEKATMIISRNLFLSLRCKVLRFMEVRQTTRLR